MIFNYRNAFAGAGAVTASLILTGSAVTAQAAGLKLDAGTVIPVTLDRQLTSNGNAKGDKFTATVKADTPGYLGLPEGTIIEGVIMEAKAKDGNDPGVLDLAFNRIRLPNGRSYAITGSTIGLDNKSVEKRDDGRIVAKSSSKNNRLTYVGYGAGAGLLASVLSGGKLHLENIGLGAGLGYLFGSLEKNKKTPNDVTLKTGTQVGVRLDSALQTADDSAGYSDKRAIDPNGDSRNREKGAADPNGGYRNTEKGGADAGSALDRPRDRNSAANNPDTPNNGATADTNGIGVLINDTNVKFAANAQPLFVNGVLMVPVRPMLDAAKIRYSFSNNNGTINAHSPNGPVRLSVGSSIAVEEAGDGRASMPPQNASMEPCTFPFVFSTSLSAAKPPTTRTAKQRLSA